MLTNNFTSSVEAEKLVKEVESINELIAAIKRGEDQACNNWEMKLTLIFNRCKESYYSDRERAMDVYQVRRMKRNAGLLDFAG